MSEIPYIDIHCHQKSHHPQVIEVRSFDLSEEIIEGGFFTIGLHPWFLEKTNESWKNKLFQRLKSDKCLGLGECGLDLNRGPEISKQKKILGEQIDLYSEVGKKLVIIHCVRAFPELASIVKNPDFIFIFHDYNGSPEQTRELLKHNSFFSYGKKLFSPNSKGFKSLSTIPLDRLFCETDGSGMKIQNVYEQMAKIKKVSLAALKECLYRNFVQVTGFVEDAGQSS